MWKLARVIDPIGTGEPELFNVRFQSPGLWIDDRGVVIREEHLVFLDQSGCS